MVYFYQDTHLSYAYSTMPCTLDDCSIHCPIKMAELWHIFTKCFVKQEQRMIRQAILTAFCYCHWVIVIGTRDVVQISRTLQVQLNAAETEHLLTANGALPTKTTSFWLSAQNMFQKWRDWICSILQQQLVACIPPEGCRLMIRI